MKLPEEVKRVERSLHADEEEKLYEAIVRDCAKVCKEYSHHRIKLSSATTEQASRDTQLHKAVTADTLADAILARYGLAPQEKQT